MARKVFKQKGKWHYHIFIDEQQQKGNSSHLQAKDLKLDHIKQLKPTRS